jgi:hypothetical protein
MIKSYFQKLQESLKNSRIVEFLCLPDYRVCGKAEQDSCQLKNLSSESIKHELLKIAVLQ